MLQFIHQIVKKMSVKSEVDKKMVSNTKYDCKICNDKFEKIAKIHYLLHLEGSYENCQECKQLFRKTNIEHFLVIFVNQNLIQL